MIELAGLFVLSWLAGAFPSARIAGHVAGGVDIRQHGSGNAGATNTLRVLGPFWAVAVLVVDFLKAFFPVLAAGVLFPGRDDIRAGAGILAVIGHVFPVFSGFRGGKGVAPAAGMMTALFPPLAPVCALIFALVLAIWRKASLASLVTAVTLPAVYTLLSSVIFNTFSFWILGLCCIISVFLVFTHRENIRRLREGREPD